MYRENRDRPDWTVREEEVWDGLIAVHGIFASKISGGHVQGCECTIPGADQVTE
jgi:hypothetical protein